MRLSPLFADTVYDILVHTGGAPERMRENFVYHHTKPDEHAPDEWRFGGKFGMGGKYWSNNNWVTYYSEDETYELNELELLINERLRIVKNLCT